MRKISILLIALIVFACDKNAEKTRVPIEATTDNTENKRYSSINLQFNNPVIIDSSAWVLYPLTLEELEETDKGFLSSGYGRQSAYWNIAFYNIETQEAKLLSDSLKMLISFINPKNYKNSHPGPRNAQEGKLIYYTISTKDFNTDGKLDAEDPRYLFVSEPSGHNLKQISPDNYDMIYWEVIKNTNKVLIQTRRDSNKDKLFDNDDELVSFVYDLITDDKPMQVFSQDFTLKMKKHLDKQWTKKK